MFQMPYVSYVSIFGTEIKLFEPDRHHEDAAKVQWMTPTGTKTSIASHRFASLGAALTALTLAEESCGHQKIGKHL
jgi:hypothetical protein